MSDDKTVIRPPGAPGAAATATTSRTSATSAASADSLTSADVPPDFYRPEAAKPDAKAAATGSQVTPERAPAVGAETKVAAKPLTSRRTRKARLRLSRVDPWSVMKTSFLFSVAGGIMFWVATYVVWAVIGSSGLFQAINDAVSQIVSSPTDQNPFQIEDYINTNKVLGTAALIAVVDIVIFTALGTLGSFLYNLSATMLGGLEITLAED